MQLILLLTLLKIQCRVFQSLVILGAMGICVRRAFFVTPKKNSPARSITNHCLFHHIKSKLLSLILKWINLIGVKCIRGWRYGGGGHVLWGSAWFQCDGLKKPTVRLILEWKLIFLWRELLRGTSRSLVCHLHRSEWVLLVVISEWVIWDVCGYR